MYYLRFWRCKLATYNHSKNLVNCNIRTLFTSQERQISFKLDFKLPFQRKRSRQCRNTLFLPTISSAFISNSVLRNENISFDKLLIQKRINTLVKEYSEAKERLESGQNIGHTELKKTVLRLQPLVSLSTELESQEEEVKELNMLIKDLEKEKDEDFLNTARQERIDCLNRIQKVEEAMLDYLVPEETVDNKDIILELCAGVGGQEAMLFTKDIFSMYCNYSSWKGWDFDVIRYDITDLGGLRQAHLSISGQHAYKILKFESGVHRVQRVPKTEKAGRIHTSTMTVAVLPQPTEIDIVLKPKDIRIELKRSSGAGGQHVNTTDSCVRLTHLPTGIVAESQMQRCQHQNRALAYKSLRAKLYERELKNVSLQTKFSRKLQIGSAGRSEKGQDKLNQLMEVLQRWSYEQSLNEILQKSDNK